jgi:hypothetical protein
MILSHAVFTGNFWDAMRRNMGQNEFVVFCLGFLMIAAVPRRSDAATMDEVTIRICSESGKITSQRIPLKRRMRVSDLINAVKGLSRRALKGRVLLSRSIPNTKMYQVQPVVWEKIVTGSDRSTDYLLKESDIIVIDSQPPVPSRACLVFDIGRFQFSDLWRYPYKALARLAASLNPRVD